ncbi:hypothetical protein BDZ45DRAFT_304648 [Acephala macrosclerotiorum]|nr:hypothetical protein BDZ45DRAFT_304648 [Acephala macrosclerotiorum]
MTREVGHGSKRSHSFPSTFICSLHSQIWVSSCSSSRIPNHLFLQFLDLDLHAQFLFSCFPSAVNIHVMLDTSFSGMIQSTIIHHHLHLVSILRVWKAVLILSFERLYFVFLGKL